MHHIKMILQVCFSKSDDFNNILISYLRFTDGRDSGWTSGQILSKQWGVQVLIRPSSLSLQHQLDDTMKPNRWSILLFLSWTTTMNENTFFSVINWTWNYCLSFLVDHEDEHHHHHHHHHRCHDCIPLMAPCCVSLISCHGIVFLAIVMTIE